MYLQQVISYGNAWRTLREQFPNELNDIAAVIADLTPETIAAANAPRNFPKELASTNRARLDGYWAAAMNRHGWIESMSAVQGAGGRPIHMRGLGYLKNQVSVVLQRNRELLNRWLFTLAPIAARNGLVEIPIGISMTHPTAEILLGRGPMSGSILERLREELIALSPLSYANSFLLLGIGFEDPDEVEVFELESEGNGTERHVVINRSIEFPPQYHQAGLGILSYFGTVLREKYPEHNAKVRIEQEGLCVRLIIESENGDREVIEKALQEYELVVRGERQPEEFFSNKSKVLELKNELRIAQVRIEMTCPLPAVPA
jgi:hypothetical protein